MNSVLTHATNFTTYPITHVSERVLPAYAEQAIEHLNICRRSTVYIREPLVWDLRICLMQ